MNILFLNEYAHPHQVSGAERSMEALAEGLKPKAKIFFLSPNLSTKSQPDKFPFPKKIKPGQTLSPIWFNNPIFSRYAAHHIKKFIRTHHIDLIHIHGKYILPAAIIAGKATRTPVVVTVRDYKFICPLGLCLIDQQKPCDLHYFYHTETNLYRKLYSPTNKLILLFGKLRQLQLAKWLKKANQIIAVSPQLAGIYRQAGFTNLVSIYNLPPVKQSKRAIPKGKTLISTGKLSYGKGTDTLLTAMSKLYKTDPKIRLVIAGEQNVSLKQNFPKNTRYLGKINHNKLDQYYRKASAFIILSRWPEPLSRASLEALSFGLPIIASDRGGNLEIVKDNGMLVNPDDPQAVADAIATLFRSNLKSLSKASLKLLSTRFNRQKIITKHLELYQALI